MIEADRAAGLEVVHSKLGAGFTLLCGTERSEAQHIRGLVEELGEAAFEVVVGGDVVEDGPLVPNYLCLASWSFLMPR